MNHKQEGPPAASQVPSRHTFPRVLITGVPGAGKTSIAAGISESIPDVEICEFGQLMAKIGKKQNLLSSYRDLSSLRLAVRARLQIAAARDVARLNQPVAIVAHVIVRAPEGYVEGLPALALSHLRLTGIIVITSDPPEISDRRSVRVSNRDGEDSILINSHQELVRQRALGIAQHHKIPIGYVTNITGELPKAISDAIQLWRDFDNHPSSSDL